MNERIAATSHLQEISYDSFKTVVKVLHAGMSEMDIVHMLRDEMEKSGVTTYWYDVGIFVLIGTDRFMQIEKAGHNYEQKSPSKDVLLKEGDVVYIDIHPQDDRTEVWGDWNSMFVFHPREDLDEEQVAFLEEVRNIQRNGIDHITSSMTASDVARYFFDIFDMHGIVLSDSLHNVGHSMHEGLKLESHRIFLDKDTDIVLGEEIYAIEPGGFRQKKTGEGILVGRFEECILIGSDTSQILGRRDLLPVTF